MKGKLLLLLANVSLIVGCGVEKSELKDAHLLGPELRTPFVNGYYADVSMFVSDDEKREVTTV